MNVPNYPMLREELAARLSFLPDKPEETADSTLRALWFTAAGTPRSAPAAMEGDLPELAEAQQQGLRELLDRRLAGVPLAHLTGRQQFLGLEMLAGADALVPRKETELLARTAIDAVQSLPAADRKPLVVDVCSGSGNVALAIAQAVPAAQVHGADLSDAAVRLAVRNAAHLGLSRVDFRVGDLLAPFDQDGFIGRIDVLTCNPPYINRAKVERMPTEIAAHEPRLAFDGGALGISILMRLLDEAPRFLAPRGWLIFEVGAGQGAGLLKRLGASGKFTEITPAEDEAGVIRVIAARR